jgi:hypothetical protein
MIKVAGNDALAIAVEYMRNNFRSDFEGAVTYIAGRVNEINAVKPSAGTRYISSLARKTSWNGVNISNPERDFKPEEWEKLKPDGQKLVNKYRNEIRNPPQGGGRGHGGHGRGGQGRDGRGSRGQGRGRGGGQGHDASLDRAVQVVVANNEEAIKKIPKTSSSVASSVTTGSPKKGGRAGDQFQN